MQISNLKFAFCNFRLDITVEIPIARNRVAAAHRSVGGPWELLPEADQGSPATAIESEYRPVANDRKDKGVAAWGKAGRSPSESNQANIRGERPCDCTDRRTFHSHQAPALGRGKPDRMTPTRVESEDSSAGPSFVRYHRQRKGRRFERGAWAVAWSAAGGPARPAPILRQFDSGNRSAPRCPSRNSCRGQQTPKTSGDCCC